VIKQPLGVHPAGRREAGGRLTDAVEFAHPIIGQAGRRADDPQVPPQIRVASVPFPHITTGRPRAWVHMRPEAIKHLAKLKHPIQFADAIGPAEAAEILGVHCSFLTRLVRAGKIIGRRPWSPKAKGKLAQNYIYSRASCRANVRLVRQIQADGGKIGRPRKLS
jgi:hypothetical protein